MGYQVSMTKRYESQKKAEKAYDAKRPKKPVSIRLDDDEMAALDKARGSETRAAYLLKALMLRMSKT
jgi:uncharacterized protein (DUF4415 family)